MVIKVFMWKCALCGATYDTQEEAEKCEAQGKITGKFCYDLHTKEILCSHVNIYMGLKNFGHPGEGDCEDFAKTRSKEPKYWITHD